MKIVSPYMSPPPAARVSVPAATNGPAAADTVPGDRFIPSAAVVAPTTAAAAPATAPPSIGLRVLAGFMLGATALGLAGCNPSPTPPSSTIGTQLTYTWMSTQDEIELGKQVSAQVEKQVPLWHDAAQQKRVDDIGARLAKDSSRKDLDKYTFKLLDTDAVNAMAVPGGTMYVTRGLLQSFPDDDQVTFVMGHEFGHIEARHSVKALGRQAAIDWALRAVTGDQGKTAQTVGRVAEGLLSNQFSQSAETEADEIGQQHLVHMKISPWKAVEAMQRLQSLSKETQPRVVERVFSDHPPTADRIAHLEKGAEKLGYPHP